MNTKENYLAKPEGLDAAGEKAYKVIMAFLKARKLTYVQQKAFYSPAEWKERGEQYGTESKLVIVIEGAEMRRCLSMDACYEVARPGTNCYEPYEALQERLEAEGLYNQDCTSWYSAIYDR